MSVSRGSRVRTLPTVDHAARSQLGEKPAEAQEFTRSNWRLKKKEVVSGEPAGTSPSKDGSGAGGRTEAGECGKHATPPSEGGVACFPQMTATPRRRLKVTLQGCAEGATRRRARGG